MKEILVLLIWLVANLIIGAFIFWGIGNLVILVFSINYSWTFLHGLVAQVIYLILRGIFSK